MKRTRYWALVGAFLFAFAACADDAGDASHSESDQSTDAGDTVDAGDSTGDLNLDLGFDSDPSIADTDLEQDPDADEEVETDTDEEVEPDIVADEEPVNQAPESVIDSPAGDIEIVRGESLTFEGTCTDPEEETPLTHLWDFGDVSESVPTEDGGAVLFVEAGEFDVTYTCTDPLGLADPTPAFVTVTVSDRHVTGQIVAHTNFNPSGIHLDSAIGLLYVLSSTTSEILEVNLDSGAERRFRLDGTFDSEGASGLTVDSEAGRIYVLVNKSGISERRGNFILAFDLDGALVGITPIASDVTVSSDPAPVRMALREVSGLDWDSESQTFYAIATSNFDDAVIAISADGTFTSVFETDELGSPTSLAIIPSGFALMNHQGVVILTDEVGQPTGDFAIEGTDEGVAFGLSFGAGSDGTSGTMDDLITTVEVDSSGVSSPDYKSEIVVRGLLTGVDMVFGGEDDEAFVFPLDDHLDLSFEARDQTHPIAFDSDAGVIYLFDGTHGRIHALNPDGSLAEGGFDTVPTPEGTELPNVRGLAYDPVSDGLWILDYDALYRFSTDGSSISVTYDVRERFDRFAIYGEPSGISFDSASGTLYVLERAATEGSYLGRLSAGEDELWGTDDDIGGWSSDNTLSGATGLGARRV